MAEQLKPPKKGILKNSTSFDKTERKSSLKETKWDEMNIIATFHPADKDYGHMKIEEPKTPYNYACPEEAADAAEDIDSDLLAQKIRLGAEQPPKAMEQVEEEEEDELLTVEEREARRQFEAKRKSHYNEFYAVKLARQLMEQDEEEEEDGAGPSSAPDQPSSSAATDDQQPAPSTSS